MRLSRFTTVLAVAAVASALSTCGGKDSPSTTTPLPSAPVVTATPTPLPTPPPVLTATCPIGMGDPTGSCSRDSPELLADVDAAINKVVSRHPEYFDLYDQRGDGGYYVKSQGAFYVALLEALREGGRLCAAFDGTEVQVKDSQVLHEQYQVIFSPGYIRRGTASYRASCYPAGFPLSTDPRPPAMSPNCHLAGSREIACGREDQIRYLHEVDEALVTAAKEHPELIDGNPADIGPDTLFRVVNPEGFVAAVQANLSKKGYCTFYDEEIGVKKDNVFSENYDILTAELRVRRGWGSYRTTCYPPAF